MKKIVSIILSLALVLSFSTNIFAAESSMNDNRANEITESEAVELARWFIANDIYENKNNGWSESTVIDTVKNDGNSYIVKLKSGSQDNGYIVVGNDVSESLIKEFSYEGEPLFVNLLPLPVENSELVSRNSSESCAVINQTEENLPYLLAVRKNLNTSLKSNSDYGGITDPYNHVNSTYGSGWTYHSGKTISDFTLLDMSNFSANNHCSLTTITAIFNYHRTHGYSSISSNINTLFNRAKTIATDNGYYTPSGGTMPYYIDNLATKVWSYYGYSGVGNNDFFFWDVNSINNALKGEVDGNRPGAISFTSGYYGNHTVTYYGYVFYKKSGQSNKMYLKVNDNWSTSARYVDTTHIGQLGQTLFEICRVLP